MSFNLVIENLDDLVKQDGLDSIIAACEKNINSRKENITDGRTAMNQTGKCTLMLREYGRGHLHVRRHRFHFPRSIPMRRRLVSNTFPETRTRF